MSTNNISEVTGVDKENFDYLLAESNYKIDKTLVLRQKSMRIPNIPVMVGPTLLDANDIKFPAFATTITELPHGGVLTAYDKFQAAKNDTAKTIPGINIPIDISAMDNAIMDLRDGEISLQAQFYYDLYGLDSVAVSDATHNLNNIAINPPTFGNQALLSLFSRAELYIDNQLIAANEFPGLSSNAEYALRYPHCKKLEKNYEVYGMTSSDKKKYKLATPIHIKATITAATGAIAYEMTHSDVDAGTSATAWPKAGKNTNLDYVFYEFPDQNQSITMKAVPVKFHKTVTGAANTVSYVSQVGITGFITQRYKLSDIFPVIDTLPPIFDHKITLKFNRAPTNILICNTNQCIAGHEDEKCYFLGFQQFKWYQDIYKITEQVQQSAKQYYSKTINTIITIDEQQLSQTQSAPSKGQNIPFNLNLNTAYKNKLLTICIPRTNGFNNQYNSISSYYHVGTSLLTEGINNTVAKQHYDILKAPANSYTNGYLRELVIKTAGGLELYNFTLQNDGHITGIKEQFNVHSPETQQNYGGAGVGDHVMMNNYEDVYRNYVKARLHFQQSEEEALDYETFLKEYCIFCIDLSPFDLSVNEQIQIVMTLPDWGTGFNPFYAGNDSTGTYMTQSIICNLFKDKILKLEPNRQCSLANMIDTKENVNQQTNMFA